MGMIINYSDMRSDETVVLIHGMASDSSTWEPTEKLIKSKGYNVLSFDLTGHGDSPRQNSYTFVNWVWDILDVIDAYPNVNRVVGHSMGGLLAAGCAARNENIQSMILLDPLLHVPSSIMRFVVKKVMSNHKAASYDSLRKNHPTWTDPIIKNELVTLHKWDVRTLEALNPSEGWEMASGFLYDKNHAETVVYKPKHSFLIPQKYVPALENQGVKVYVVPDVGHSMHLDNIKTYTKILHERIPTKVDLLES